jgi:molybdate transport system substrate-binding protein
MQRALRHACIGAAALSLEGGEDHPFLSAGAAQGLVTTIAAEAGIEVAGTFSTVGAIREKVLAGEACDIVILTQAQIAELAAQGRVVAGTCADLGTVRTSIAVKSGSAVPDIRSEDALRATLLAADVLYFPDPEKATAGIHFMKVLDALGIRRQAASKFKTYPNGATSMREMALAGGNPVGCTQATEILATPGIMVVGGLPKSLELATVYTAAMSAAAADRVAAGTFIARLAGEPSRSQRERAGFQP